MISSKVYRPFWMDDSSSDCCLQCKSKFTPVQRRHHCRSCGNLFCNNCADKKQTLPHLHYNKPVRICKNCDDLVNYLKLAQSNQMTDKIESSKGFCTSTLDSKIESKKMIIKGYLETFYHLLTFANNSNNNNNFNYNPIIFKFMSKAIANLSQNEYYRSDLIEANLLQPLVYYICHFDEAPQSKQSKQPLQQNPQQLQSPSINQLEDSQFSNDELETLLNVCQSFENLALIENQIVKELADKCLPKLIELLSKFQYNFQLKTSISTVLLNLTKNTQTRELIMKHNAIHAFLMNSLGDDSQESSAESISVLSLVPKYHRKIIESGTLPHLTLMLTNPNDKVIQHATLALSNLSISQENQLTISQVGCITPLIKIITEKNNFDYKILLNTATTFYNISTNKSSCTQLIQQDLIDSLTKIVILNYKNQSNELLNLSLKILGNISNEKEGKNLIKKNQSMMSALRIMIHTTNKLQSLATVIFNNCEPQLNVPILN